MTKYSKVTANFNFHTAESNVICLAISSLCQFLAGPCSLSKNVRENLPLINKQS